MPKCTLLRYQKTFKTLTCRKPDRNETSTDEKMDIDVLINGRASYKGGRGLMTGMFGRCTKRKHTQTFDSFYWP